MQNKFLSKSVPRGTRTIWRYLGALFILFTFATGNVWADATYKLFCGATADVDGTNLNTTDFWTSATPTNGTNSDTYTKYVTLGGNVKGTTSLATPANYIAYSVKTTSTEIKVIVYSKNKDTQKLYFHDVKEKITSGKATASLTNKDIASKTKDEEITYTSTNDGKATIYISAGKATDTQIYQIIVTEKGTALTDLYAGYAGYSINLNKGRVAAKAGEVTVIDKLSICPSGDHKPTNNSEIILVTLGTHYVSFTAQEDCALKLTVNSNVKYTLGSAKNVAGTTEYGGAAGTYTTVLEEGETYFINPVSGNTSDFKITKIEFVPVYPVTYAAGEGSGTMDAKNYLEDDEVTLPACTFTAPTSSEFNGWVVTKTASGDAVTVTKDGDNYKFTMPAEAVTVTAQWAVATPKYTVIYKDGETELKRVPVEVGKTPEAYTPTKDFYTFTSWSTNPSTLGSTAANTEVTLTASWTPNYAFGAYSFNALTVGTSPAKTINGNEVVYDDPFRVDNFYFDGGIKIQGEVGTDAEGLALDNFKGWKLKTTGKNIKFLVENNCQVKVAVGSANTLKVIYTALDGTEKNVNLAQQTETPYLVKGGTIVTLQTTTGSTITIKRIEISALYDATLTDTKSDGSASKPSVAEVTLPTPTAVSGWTYTGWIATQDVKDSEGNTKTAGTLLAAGTYTLLDNTTFTAQWVQLYAVTYDNNGGDGIMTDSNSPYAEGAEVTLLDNTFTAPTNKIFGSWVATYNDGTEKTLTITNGKFTMPAYNVTVTAQWVDDNKVAKIGETYYTSLEGAEGAFANVADGQTIELLKNCDVTSQLEIAAGVTATIDLNGYKIEYTGSTTLPSGVILVHNGASLTINDSSEPSTGKVFAGTKAYAAVALTKLGDDASTPATLVVNGGALTGYYYGITGNGSRNNTVITINGGTITGTVGTAIYNPQVGTLTVNNGTLTGLDAAIEMRAGTLVINDGTFTATATEFSCNPNGSGSTTTGAAIAIAQHTTKKEISVTINGGTFNGVKAINESNPQVNDPAPQVTMAVTAGTFTGEVTTVDVNNFISGGTFDHEVAANQCAEGYAPEDNGDGTYGVKPLAQTFSLEDLVTAQGTSANYTTYLNNLGWTVANADALDNLNTDKDYDNYPYLGLKFKNAAGYVAGEVEGGKLLTIKLGHMAGVAHLMVDDVKKMELDGVDAETPKVHYYYVENTANVKLLMANAGSKQTCVLKAITVADPFTVTFDANGGEAVASQNGTPSITLPSATKDSEVFKGWYDAAEGGNLIGKANDSYTPTASVTLHAQWEAVSSDATLSALEVDGATVAGFDPETYIYNIVCEYGHTPEITLATATAGDLATVTINNEPVDEGTYKYVQVKVVPQSGEEGKKFYQVRYTNKPKQGVTLIKATHTGAKTAEVTGYLGGTYDKNTASDGKLGDANTYFGIKLTEGNFQAGDVLYIHANTVSSAVRIYSDKGTTRINAEDGTFDANKMFTYTLTAETEWIYIYRKVKDGESDMNPYVDYIEVQRHMAPFIESFEIEGIGALDINPTTNAITATVPESFDVTNLEPTIKAWANGSAHLDKSGAQDFTNPVTYTVTSDYAEDGEVTYTVTITKVAPSATPVITTNPAGANYYEGATITALNVEASVTDGGTLSYQWQEQEGENWNDITNATSDSYTPTVSAIGTYKYRVVVTNTLTDHPAAQATSAVATIVIAEDPSCKAIGYGAPRALALNTEVVIDATTGLKHKSSKDAVEGGRKIKNVSDIDGIKLDGNAYYDIYTTEMNIGSVAVSLTSNSNGTKRKFAVIFCSAAEFDAAKILGIVEQTGGAGDEEQVINTPDVPLGTKLVRIMRYYKDANNNEYGEGSSSWIYYARVCLVEPAQEVTASVTDEPASANYCPSDVVAPLAYELSMEEGASAAYQWYKGTTAIENATETTYTPSETGVYSCKAVVTKTGRLNKKLTSAEATVNFYEATEITGFENAAAPLNTEKTLSVTAAGTGTLTYKWQACTEAGVVTDENVLSSAATYGVTITEEPQYYLVTVEGECGSATQVLFAKKWADLELVDVDGSMTWNFAASNTGITGDVAVPSTMVLANAGQGAMPNTDNFHSDMLKAIVGSTETKVRKSTDDGCYQGTGIMFHTTVPGIVTVTYRGTGNNADVTLTVGSKTFDTYHGGFTTCDKVFVPAGDVEISSVGTMRIQKIVFNAKPDYTRDVTEGRYGTICLPKAGVMTGATLYEVAYYGATSKKIFFDEVLNGEMQAGVPYIFLPEEGADQLGVFYTNDAVETAKSANGLVGFIGANKEDAQEVPVGSYILSNNQYRKVVYAESAYIKSNRSYIDLSAINPSEPTLAPGRRRISMSVQGEQTATDIDNIFGNDTKAEKVLINGQLFILRGGKMFDAAGQLVK